MLQQRELATVLAALRHWQATVLAAGPVAASQFDHFDEVTTPLTLAEIDDLCQRLNLGPEEDDGRCDCERPGFYACGVPGVLAHLENGRVAPGAIVERCDFCKRIPTDEAALKKLVELGIA